MIMKNDLIKKISVIIFAAVVILVISKPFSYSRNDKVPETIVKIGFLDNRSRIHVKSDGDITAVDILTMEHVTLKRNRDAVVKPLADGGIQVADTEFNSPVRFIPKKSKKFIRINGRRYRDTVVVRNEKGKLTVINELGLDGYLFGVLPVEVSPKWPMEALKAQAIVSRTYVLANLGKYGSKGYDMSSNVFSQVYRGVEVESAATNKAVKETAGMVLTYKGKLSKAFFFACCGGHTADVKKVWKNPYKYLKGIVCGFCKESPHYYWDYEITPEELRKKLKRKKIDTGIIKKIKFESRTKSGRIDGMKIKHSKGNIDITGHRFRMILGPDKIKSTLFTIDRSKPKYFFYGRGWGHGVGLCQWGSKEMAEKGKNYRSILKRYFPGTKVKKWSY